MTKGNSYPKKTPTIVNSTAATVSTMVWFFWLMVCVVTLVVEPATSAEISTSLRTSNDVGPSHWLLRRQRRGGGDGGGGVVAVGTWSQRRRIRQKRRPSTISSSSSQEVVVIGVSSVDDRGSNTRCAEVLLPQEETRVEKQKQKQRPPQKQQEQPRCHDHHDWIKVSVTITVATVFTFILNNFCNISTIDL